MPESPDIDENRPRKKAGLDLSPIGHEDMVCCFNAGLWIIILCVISILLFCGGFYFQAGYNIYNVLKIAASVVGILSFYIPLLRSKFFSLILLVAWIIICVVDILIMVFGIIDAFKSGRDFGRQMALTLTFGLTHMPIDMFLCFIYCRLARG
ncbi:unnamed protein product [Caenorhabditis bovis]|uniref:Uncharacterized protein n=1 Tax=Caenorhabditis bovis TaxID=2654633 RepID=A0A8S1EUW9_9PELO|nr:unnamed protein product [Caenorhabditis bovis]